MKGDTSFDVLVVDFDQTLFLHSFWTRLFFRVSKLFHILALRYEKLNKCLAEDIRNYRVVILTGRNRAWEKDLLKEQLRKHQVEYEEIILCPRMKVIMDWKRRELEEIEKKYGSYYWIDDMK